MRPLIITLLLLFIALGYYPEYLENQVVLSQSEKDVLCAMFDSKINDTLYVANGDTVIVKVQRVCAVVRNHLLRGGE